MTLTGNAGVLFDLSESATTSTGSIVQDYTVPSAIGQLTVATTDIVYTVSGTVGTTSFDFDLNAVNNQSGTGYSTTVVRNNAGDFTSLKQIVIYNTHASNNLIIGSPAANSLFTWNSTSDTFAILPGAAFPQVYSTALTIGSNGKVKIVGSAASTTFLIYVLGA